MTAVTIVRLGNVIALSSLMVVSIAAWVLWRSIPTEGELSDRVRVSLLEQRTKLEEAVAESLPLGMMDNRGTQVFFDSAFSCSKLKISPDSRYELTCSRFFKLYPREFNCGYIVEVTLNVDHERVVSRRIRPAPAVCK